MRKPVNSFFLFCFSFFILNGCSYPDGSPTYATVTNIPAVTIVPISPVPSTKPRQLYASYEGKSFEVHSYAHPPEHTTQEVAQMAASSIAVASREELERQIESEIIHDSEKISTWINTIFLATQDSKLIKDFFWTKLNGVPVFDREDPPGPYNYIVTIKSGTTTTAYQFYVDDAEHAVFTKNEINVSFKKYKMTKENAEKLKTFFESLVY